MAISSKFIYKLVLLVIVFCPRDLFCQENPSFHPSLSPFFPSIQSLAVENLSCDPDSPFLERLSLSADLAFCAQWNPDFVFNGHHCCPRKSTLKSKGRPRCSPRRAKSSYCEEMTEVQKKYIELANLDQGKDITAIINHELLKKLTFQAFCEVNSGFLVNGRPLLSSLMNKIEFKSPQKCTYFGTNAMIDMLDWLGKEVHKEYFSEQFSDVKLVIGDISAPRGGCLSGRGGRRGHRSHTTGQDVDLGFLLVKGGKSSTGRFHQVFDAQTNWWLLKKLFQNPYACIQKIFLDRKLIQKLAHFAKADPKWSDLKKIIKHVRGHRNHFHIRIGNAAGKPGCPSEPASLDEEDVEEEEEELLGLVTK